MIYILLADGFEEIEALTPADFLRRAGIDTVLVGITGRTVTGGQGIQVVADIAFDEIDPAALTGLILPGGRTGAQTLRDDDGVRALVASAVADSRVVAAICAGPMVLGGLPGMDNRRFTCYPGFEIYIPEGIYCDGLPVVRDGNIITGRSAAASAAFAFAIIEALLGGPAARAVSQAIMYD